MITFMFVNFTSIKNKTKHSIKKSDAKAYDLCEFIYLKFENRLISDDRNQNSGCSGGRKGQ